MVKHTDGTVPSSPGAVVMLSAKNNRVRNDSSRPAKKRGGSTLSDSYWKTLVIQFLQEQNGSVGSQFVGKYLSQQPPFLSSDPSCVVPSSLAEIKGVHGSLMTWMRGHTDTFLLEKGPPEENSIVVHLTGQRRSSEVSASDSSGEKAQPRPIKTNGTNPPPSLSDSYWKTLVIQFLQEQSDLGASSGKVGSYLLSQPASTGLRTDAQGIRQSALQELKECHGNLARWVLLHTDELVWEQSLTNKKEFMIRLNWRVRPETTSTVNSNSTSTAITKVEDPETTSTASLSRSSRESLWKRLTVQFLSRNQGAATTRDIGKYLASLPSSGGRCPSVLAEFKEDFPSLKFWLQGHDELFAVEPIPTDSINYMVRLTERGMVEVSRLADQASRLTERGLVQASLDAMRAEITEMKTSMHHNLHETGESKKSPKPTTSVPTEATQRELRRKESQLRQTQEALAVSKDSLAKAQHERDDALLQTQKALSVSKDSLAKAEKVRDEALRLLDLACRARDGASRSLATETNEKERLEILWGDSHDQLALEKETVRNLRSELDGTIERLESVILSREDLQNRLRSEFIVRQKAEADVVKLTNQLVRKQAPGGSNKLERVKTELNETQAKLAREKEKYRAAFVRTQEVREAKPPELSDWMHAFDVPVRVMQRTEVPQGAPEPTELSHLSHFSSEPAPSESTNYAVPEPFTPHDECEITFCGLEDSDDMNEKDRLDAELAFVMSSYGADELRAASSVVVRFLDINVDQDSTVRVNLTLCIPEGYPASGTLNVTAEIADGSTGGSTVFRKIMFDSLLGLVNVCQWEANGCQGNEALLDVLTTADRWVKNEWAGIRAKNLAEKEPQKDANEGAGPLEICRLLVYSHHITEPEKVQLLKKEFSKSGIGGFIRIGRPGFVLAEGLEENCDNFLAAIVQQRKKNREKGKGKVDSSYFTQAAKVLTTVSDFETGRSFSKKVVQLEGPDSFDELRQMCEQVGLTESLEEACTR